MGIRKYFTEFCWVCIRNIKKKDRTYFSTFLKREPNLICQGRNISQRLRENSLLLWEIIWKSRRFFCSWPLSGIAISKVLLQIQLTGAFRLMCRYLGPPDRSRTLVSPTQFSRWRGRSSLLSLDRTISFVHIFTAVTLLPLEYVLSYDDVKLFERHDQSYVLIVSWACAFIHLNYFILYNLWFTIISFYIRWSLLNNIYIC